MRRISSMHSKVHSFKSPSRAHCQPSFLLFFLPPRRPPTLPTRRPSARCYATLGALRSHDVTRAGITHTRTGARVSGPARRREGRDSFEPRLVFASPCVPRTSYFNETVSASAVLSLSFFLPLAFSSSSSLSLFSSRRLAREPTDRPTGPLARSRLAPSLFLSSFYHLALARFFPHPPF